MFDAENTLAISLLRGAFVALVILQVGQVTGKPREPKKKICTTPECISMAKAFAANMDRNIKPCNDFYTYACGNWEANNPKPANTYQWSVHSIMRREKDVIMKDLLLSVLRRTKNGAIYRTCLDKPTLEKSDPIVIKSYVKSSKYWPMILNKKTAKSLYQPWWAIDNYYIKLTGESALFSANTILNDEHGGLPLQSLFELITPYGSILRHTPWDEEGMIYYKHFLINLIKEVSPVEVDERALWVHLKKVLTFRFKLEQIIKLVKNEELNTNNPKCIQQFQKWHDKHMKGSTKVNWLEIIRSLYGPKYSSKINDQTLINVARKTYFRMLVDSLLTESEETIVNHIQLYFVEKYTKLSSTLWGILLKAAVRNVESTIQITHISERWRTCIDKLNPDLDMLTAYVDTAFRSKKIKHRVEQLFSDVKNVVKKEISDCTWLDDDTKNKLVTKTMKTKIWCGYPKWYDDFSLKQRYRDVDMNPTVINAYLITNHNLVVVNAAILQYPMYSKDFPYIMNYASIGTLIAHELYHHFGENALNLNEEGKYVKSYWSSDMLGLYNDRKMCFIDQYSNYDITELGQTKTDLKCRGRQTYEENFADTMGVKTAFALYTERKTKEDDSCTVIPGFEEFSCDQFFFLSFANSLCGVISKDFLLYYLKKATHALPRLRINGALSNMEEFSSAYHCNVEAPMNPTTKCNLWT
uniref:Neprilysin-like protein 12 n=1 Tax=Ampulex compressa TaxID=860918 RepID=A0A1W6EWC5_AMPCP|nr:neprilysin-like protein 12 [Ampulex compressa]